MVIDPTELKPRITVRARANSNLAVSPISVSVFHIIMHVLHTQTNGAYYLSHRRKKGRAKRKGKNERKTLFSKLF
jgi:hypothetical protein